MKFDHDEQCLHRVVALLLCGVALLRCGVALLRCGVALRCSVSRLCCSEPEGWPFLPFDLAVARQRFAVAKDYATTKVPFAGAKGPDFCPVFLVFPFLRFFTKNSQNSKYIMGITPNDIQIPS